MYELLDKEGLKYLWSLTTDAIAENPGYKVYHITDPGISSDQWEYDFAEGDKETLTELVNSILNDEKFRLEVGGGSDEWRQWPGYEASWNLDNEYDWSQDPRVLNGYRLRISWKNGTWQYNLEARLDVDKQVTSEKWEGNGWDNQTNAWGVQYNYYDQDKQQNVSSTVGNFLDQQRNVVNKSIKKPDYQTIGVNSNKELTTTIGGSWHFTNKVYWSWTKADTNAGSYDSGGRYYTIGSWDTPAANTSEYTNYNTALNDLKAATQQIGYKVKFCYSLNGKLYYVDGKCVDIYGYTGLSIPTTTQNEGDIGYTYFNDVYAQLKIFQEDPDTSYVIDGVWVSVDDFKIAYDPIGKEYVPVDNKTIRVGSDGIETVIGGSESEEEQGEQIALCTVTGSVWGQHTAISDISVQYSQNSHGAEFTLADNYQDILPAYGRVKWASGRVDTSVEFSYFREDNNGAMWGANSYNQGLYNIQIHWVDENLTAIRVSFVKEDTEQSDITDSIKSVEIRSKPWATIIHPIDPKYIPVDNETVLIEDGKLKANVDTSDYATHEEVAAVQAKVDDLPLPVDTERDFLFRTFLDIGMDSKKIETDDVEEFVKQLKRGRVVYWKGEYTRFDSVAAGLGWCQFIRANDSGITKQNGIGRYIFIYPFRSYYLTIQDPDRVSIDQIVPEYNLLEWYNVNLATALRNWVLGDYATKAEIPNVSNYATKDELAAVEGEIPSIEGLATTEQVNRKQDKLANGSTENNALVWDADSESWVPGVIESGSSYPEPPAANGNYQLLAIVNNGEVEYSWVTLSGVWQYPLQTGNNLALYQGAVINQYNNNLEII